MMKILVFSDSHGRVASMERAIRLEQPDQILHLGDCVPDAQALKKFGIPLLQVAGNCDYGSTEPEIRILDLEGTRIYMTHGHLHGVKTMYQRAIYAAMGEDAQILLFGHTHQAECYCEQGLWILNPGAAGAWGSYGVIQLTDGRIDCCLKSV